ncbi:lasso RiPP family leader peptide-containing protein [Streptomyces sp. NPDC048275]
MEEHEAAVTDYVAPELVEVGDFDDLTLGAGGQNPESYNLLSF